MESNWKIHFTLCTRNRRTKTMVINCEYGLKTSIDNDFSARIKKIKKNCVLTETANQIFNMIMHMKIYTRLCPIILHSTKK